MPSLSQFFHSEKSNPNIQILATQKFINRLEQIEFNQI